MRRNTIENCHRLAQKKGGKCLSSQYIRNDTNYLWECKNGHRWKAKYSNILQDRWCPHCIGRYKNIEDCRKLAKSKNGECLSAKYINNRTKYKWKCSKGHIWFSSYTKIQGGAWCPDCGGTKRLTKDSCISYANKMSGKFLSDTYKNNSTKYLWECSNGHRWSSNFANIKSGHWCPECANVIKNSIDSCHKMAHINNGLFLSKKYVNAHTKYKWRCNNNHIWSATYNNIRNGRWCPKCKNKTQTFIYNVCKELFPNYNIEYNYKSFSWLDGQEIDIFIHDLKLAIEYDGEQHFKPVPFGGCKEKAKKMLANIKKRDHNKNIKIKKNPQDVKYFIRFNYTENITKKYILRRVNELLD